jgi:hypothetical protein
MRDKIYGFFSRFFVLLAVVFTDGAGVCADIAVWFEDRRIKGKKT